MMRVSRELDLRPDLAKLRSDAAKERIAESSRQPGARPIMLGVFQMRNTCSGAAGKDANLKRMIDAILVAKSHGVQMLAMPEMCLQGYYTWVSGSVQQAVGDTHELADRVGESRHLQQLQDACRDTSLVLAFGFAERQGEDIYNSIGLIDTDGRWLGTRRKNPLYPYDYETKVFRQPSREQRSAVFDTRLARVGLANCFDGEFPETVRQMRLEGAEILLWCNAPCGDPSKGTTARFVEAGGHARANDLWVACCSCVASNTTGGSVIFSPTSEPLVLLSPDEEELGLAAIDLASHRGWEMRQQRVCADVQRQCHLQ